MSIETKSGASADLLTIDPTSKAARTTPYDSAGTELNAPPAGSYVAPFQIRFTAATAANSAVVLIRNGGTRALHIRRLYYCVAFDGTAAAALSRFELVRFSGSSASSGGTAITPAKKRTTYAASTVTDARFETAGAALTNTSATYDASGFGNFGIPRTPTGQIVSDEMWFNHPDEVHDVPIIDTGTGNGVAIRILNTAVIGDSLTGYIEYDER